MSKLHKVPAYMLNRLSKLGEPKKIKIGKIWPYLVVAHFPREDRTSDIKLAAIRSNEKMAEVFGKWDDETSKLVDNIYRSVCFEDTAGNVTVRYYRKDMPKDSSRGVITETDRFNYEVVRRNNPFLVLQDRIRFLIDWENLDVDKYTIDYRIDQWNLTYTITFVRKDSNE